MRYRHSLRFRIIISYLVFGIVIGGLLAVFLYTLLSKLEEQLVTGIGGKAAFPPDKPLDTFHIGLKGPGEPAHFIIGIVR